MNEPHIKGAAFGEFIGWYAEQHDLTPIRRVVAALPPEQRAGLEPDAPKLGVVVSNWYPTTVVDLVLDQIVSLHGENGSRVIAHDGVQVVSARMFRGLYAVLFGLVASPTRYARHIQRAWLQLHDTGTREVTIERANEALSVTRNWRGHHPLMCDITLETMRAVFERMGCDAVEVSRIQCVGAGAPDCRARVRWRG
ncbi:MAG: hypothetical protein WCJ30_14300 [Deltaproteobacteria bacterium]